MLQVVSFTQTRTHTLPFSDLADWAGTCISLLRYYISRRSLYHISTLGAAPGLKLNSSRHVITTQVGCLSICDVHDWSCGFSASLRASVRTTHMWRDSYKYVI